jgi:transcriptional repressor NrdR
VECPYCQNSRTRVIDTSHDSRGGIRRRRVCTACDERFTTYERPVLATPLLVKRDGTREEFSRDKLMAGIRLACTKRPISAEQIERIVGEIESELQQKGTAEVSSRLVGDRVINRLKALDDVAYLRYAIVYLQLNDLEAIKAEIDRLFTN